MTIKHSLQTLMSRKNYLILTITLFLLITGFACAKNDGRTPEEIVKQYFEFCSKGKFDDAEKLTCSDYKCLDTQGNGEADNVVIIPRFSTVDEDGKVTSNDDLKNSDDAPHNLTSEFWSQADMINDEKFEVTKITGIENSEYFAEVTLEAEGRNGYKTNFVTCLRREKRTKNWKIGIVLLSEWVKSNGDSHPCVIPK